MIAESFSRDSLSVLAVNNTSSVTWLDNYRRQRGISYSFTFDTNSALFNLYQVGASYGNYPPTYIIIDQNGIVRYRIDKEYNHFDEMKKTIQDLLKK